MEYEVLLEDRVRLVIPTCPLCGTDDTDSAAPRMDSPHVSGSSRRFHSWLVGISQRKLHYTLICGHLMFCGQCHTQLAR
ncbi:hypothetical protein COOONC_08827 [Cooperia oncophora]